MIQVELDYSTMVTMFTAMPAVEASNFNFPGLRSIPQKVKTSV